jgi:hypothetical protein
MAGMAVSSSVIPMGGAAKIVVGAESPSMGYRQPLPPPPRIIPPTSPRKHSKHSG